MQGSRRTKEKETEMFGWSPFIEELLLLSVIYLDNRESQVHAYSTIKSVHK